MKENRPNRQSNTQAKATRGTRKEQPSARLVVAYALLQMMRQSAYSNLVAESRFDALESPRDRAFASTLFYGVLERQITLRRIVAAYCRKPVQKLDPEVLCILEMGLYQLLFLDSVPERAAVNESVLLIRKLGKQSAGGFVNGVLRAFIRDGKPLCPGAEKLSPLERLSAEASAPEELCQLLMEQYGEETARRVLLDGDEAFARVRGYLCDAAAIGACYREHVGPPSKPLKSQIRDLQRALGRAEVPGVPDELARLLAEEKEEGAEKGARKVKEDWGDVDEEAW